MTQSYQAFLRNSKNILLLESFISTVTISVLWKSRQVAFLSKTTIPYRILPDGVRKKSVGKKHNQRLRGWEYGKNREYLNYKSKQARIESFNGSERGTSSHCPECGKKKKRNGRWWKYRHCRFEGHRDVVGALNMFLLAFDKKIAAPKDITYLRILVGKSSSRLGTGQSCLNASMRVIHTVLGVAPSNRSHSFGQFRSSSPLGD
ncbi:MAG: zinc ribbon domain-containing protein [Candidatus Neptunochlamydia sp.]|nr:zinc ribbon domain-containing protein [Candidatus Neptunochlamydia sp.]